MIIPMEIRGNDSPSGILKLELIWLRANNERDNEILMNIENKRRRMASYFSHNNNVTQNPGTRT